MRHAFVVGVLILLPVAAWGQHEWAGEHRCAHAKMQAARFAGAENAALRGPGLRDEGAADTDVLHYDLELEINPTNPYLTGSNLMTVRSLVDGLNVFRFRLSNRFTVTDLTVDNVAAGWTRLDEATLEVTLDATRDANEVFELFVAYNGQPQTAGNWGSIVFSQHGPSSAPVVWTLSQPWWSHTWWPCKDENWDKATADLAFIVPESLTVASNGVLQSITDVGVDQKRHHWKTNYPIAPYLVSFVTTNFATFEDVWEYDRTTMPLQFFIYPEHNSGGNRAEWLRTKKMLTVMSDLYGPYPFINEKYGMAEFGWGGGMEHQTMTSQGGFWEYITAHELAHQWWGDAITCATWHDIWLNEGFAVYSEALWYENHPDYGGGPEWLHFWMNEVRLPDQTIDTVYVYDISNMGRVFSDNTTYRKAAWVLHMLRHVVGDDAFFDILAEYRSRFEGGSATTEDFQEACEHVIGKELDWFFAEWVYQGSWPRYRWAWQQHVVNGQHYVEVYVRQLNNPLFSMPIDFVVTVAGQPSAHAVWSDARSEHLLFPVAGPAESVEFDPTPWFLRRGLSETPFEEGPPKIVTIDPPPGHAEQPGRRTQLEIVFHKDVLLDPNSFRLVGQKTGEVPLAVTYDPNSFTATLVAPAALPMDYYTLVVFDNIIDVAGGKALDGELAKVWFDEPLPSGDGEEGGRAIAHFAITNPAAGDTNCDGTVDTGDVDPFILALLFGESAYDAAYPNCDYATADVDGDGQVSFSDINPFVLLLN